MKANLAQFAWIDSVSLVKHWPNTVVVTVHEATAVAVAFDAQARAAVRRRAAGATSDRRRCTRTARRCEYVASRERARGPSRTRAVRPRTSRANCRAAFGAQVSVITEDDHGIVDAADDDAGDASSSVRRPNCTRNSSPSRRSSRTARCRPVTSST